MRWLGWLGVGWLACVSSSGCSRENPWFSVYGASASESASDTVLDATGPDTTNSPDTTTSVNPEPSTSDTTSEPVDNTSTTSDTGETTTTTGSTTTATSDATDTSDTSSGGPEPVEVLHIDLYERCPSPMTQWDAGANHPTLDCIVMPEDPPPPSVRQGPSVPYNNSDETTVLTHALDLDQEALITGHFRKLELGDGGDHLRFRSVLINPGPDSVQATLFFEDDGGTVIGEFHFTEVLAANADPLVLDLDLSEVPFTPTFTLVMSVVRKSEGNVARLHWLRPRIIDLVP